MISSKKAGFLVVVLGLLVPLAAAAHSSGSCIALMSASLDSAVLIKADATEDTVISSPTPILLVGDEGELKGTVSITQNIDGPFTSIRVTLSGISFSTFADCATGSIAGNPSTLTDLAIAIEEDDDDDSDDPDEDITPGSPVSLEIEFEPEDGLESDSAGCFTGTFVSDPSVAFEAELEDDAGEEEDLELSGAVTAQPGAGGAGTFDLDVNGDGIADFTITTDGTTVFKDPLTALSDLTGGELVEAEVDVQPDGMLHATEVELLFDDEGAGGATGRIACVVESSPASSITLVFAPSAPDHPFPSTTLQVNITDSTKYKVNKGNINTSGFVFNRENLSPGQRLTAAGTPVSGGDPPQVDATKLILKLQMVDGMLDGSVNSGAGTFQLTITSASDVLLTEPITVKVFPMTKFVGRLRNISNLNTTDTYRVTGLLMRNSTDGTLTLLAKKVKKVKIVAAP